jgi:hypothetical protein
VSGEPAEVRCAARLWPTLQFHGQDENPWCDAADYRRRNVIELSLQ